MFIIMNNYIRLMEDWICRVYQEFQELRFSRRCKIKFIKLKRRISVVIYKIKRNLRLNIFINIAIHQNCFKEK